MKISKTLIIILGVVVFGVALGLLYMQYTKQQDEQTSLKAKIAANQATVSKLAAERDNWQLQLNKLNDQLDQKRAQVTAATLAMNQAKTGWPTSVESIEYGEAIFGLANGWNLDITSLTTSDNVAKAVESIGFLNTTFSVSVTSPPLTSGFAFVPDYENYVYQVVGNILGFIDAVAKDKNFATANIDLVNMTVPPMLTADELVAQGAGVPSPTATITVTVYTYSGG